MYIYITKSVVDKSHHISKTYVLTHATACIQSLWIKFHYKSVSMIQGELLLQFLPI